MTDTGLLEPIPILILRNEETISLYIGQKTYILYTHIKYIKTYFSKCDNQTLRYIMEAVIYLIFIIY